MNARFPQWIRRSWGQDARFADTKALIEGMGLRTVCQSARCPNMGECWARQTATLMILGNTCTRNCRYCYVSAGKPEPPDPDEPRRVAEAVQKMGLKHAVITSVTRDDLPDGGARYFAQTVEAVRALNPQTTVELLTPDFQGDREAVRVVLASGPDVFAHNIETVRRLFPVIRSRRYGYDLSLAVLRTAANYGLPMVIKSAFMVGHGESYEEVRATLMDLLDAGCEAVSLGQYLRPSSEQQAVVEYIHPEQFAKFEDLAYDLGFKFVAAGPFVRSSYRSEEMVPQLFVRKRIAATQRAEECFSR